MDLNRHRIGPVPVSYENDSEPLGPTRRWKFFNQLPECRCHKVRTTHYVTFYVWSGTPLLRTFLLLKEIMHSCYFPAGGSKNSCSHLNKNVHSLYSDRFRAQDTLKYRPFNTWALWWNRPTTIYWFTFELKGFLFEASYIDFLANTHTLNGRLMFRNPQVWWRPALKRTA